MRSVLLCGLGLLAFAGCASTAIKPCEFPALTDASVKASAYRFLQQQGFEDHFLEKAKYRIWPSECTYVLHMGEKLESFGPSWIVEVNRREKVVDFSGIH